MTEYEEIINSGKIYNVMGLTKKDIHYYDYLQQMEKYNSLGYSKKAEKEKEIILKELFAEVGENAYIQALYHSMWGGHHVHLGNNVYINFNCTFVDDAQIYIGDNSIIGAGSLVNKDIPSNVIAWGNPAKVIREITEDDDIYYDYGKLVSENIVK